MRRMLLDYRGAVLSHKQNGRRSKTDPHRAGVNRFSLSSVLSWIIGIFGRYLEGGCAHGRLGFLFPLGYNPPS